MQSYQSKFTNQLNIQQHSDILSNKETVTILKECIDNIENAFLKALSIPSIEMDSAMSFLKRLMPEPHFNKLAKFFLQPLTMDITQVSIYTIEGEVSLPIIAISEKQGNGMKLFLLSEGGNVATLVRLAYKLIRLMFNMKYRSFEDNCHRIKHKLAKKEN